MANGGIKDGYNLERFLEAQEGTYERALRELRAGRKHSHWMWFIFPQILGLGRSRTAVFYSIRCRSEARAYLGHPALGKRLRECTETLLTLEDQPVSRIFSFPDDLKFHSSMTLFADVHGRPSVFHDALEKYFDGKIDLQTIQLLEKG